MSSRLIEVFLPESERATVEELLADHEAAEAWYEALSQQQLWVRIFIDSTKTEAIIDQFDQQFDGVEGFRLLLLEVEASLPYETNNDSKSVQESVQEEVSSDVETKLNPKESRIYRAEIYDRVAGSAELSWSQLAMVLLSTAIATIGILRDNQAVVIGAMVIAPLLKPNMALAVATTLGDTSLAIRTVLTGMVGVLLALIFAVGIGLAVPVDLSSSEIASRIHVGWSDGILAFASGMAGAIALTTEERSSIVGVMVSVALLPPLVVLGLLLGAGFWAEAISSALLVTTNLICLNLAAVTTFLVQDLRPRQWKEVPKAKQFTQMAYGIWLLLLMGLVGVVCLTRLDQVPLF